MAVQFVLSDCHHQRKTLAREEKIMSVTYADVDRVPLETEYTWLNRLPRGGVVLIPGWRMSAKGLLACNVAAAITTGKPLPGETGMKPPADVIVVCAEDDPNEDMAWRLRAAGADLTRVHDMTEMSDGAPFELSASASVEGNTPELLTRIRQLKVTCVADDDHVSFPGADVCEECGGPLRDPRLVILDPLNALVMYGTIKTDQGARRVIRRLQHVAKRTGVTIIVIHHLVKNGSIGGSQGLEDAARWVYKIESDPLAPEYKVFHLHKCNVAVAEDLRYRVISDGHNSRIEWVDRAMIEREDRSWRTKAAGFLTGATTSSRPSPGRALAAGCKHSRTKFGTVAQCGDCPARNLAATPVNAVKARRFAAVYAVTAPGCAPVTHPLGLYPDLVAAQAACGVSAATELTWVPDVTRPGTWVAPVPRADGTGVSYAVSGG